MSELFSIQLQNRQHQGRDGVWLDLPTTTEQVQVALRQIGISSDNPQGLFISGYFAEEEKRFAISYNMVLASNVDELNFLASRLETLSTGERAELNAALQAPQSELFSIGRITDFPENVDYYVHLPDVHGPAQLGDYYLNRSGMVNMPEEWKGGIDTAQFGRYVAQQEQGAFTQYGYLVKSGDEWQKVHEGQPVPEEYRVLSFPAPEVLRDSANIPPPVQPETEPQKVIPIILNGKDSAERMKEITDRLETGIQELFDSDRYKAYLTTMAKFHNYSFNNTLLIAMQGGQLVAGFNKWKDTFHRTVKKGERGIKILAPAPYKVKQKMEKLDEQGKPVLDKDGKPLTEEKTVQIPAFKVVSVFDVSQTEGEPLPTLGVEELTGDVERYQDFFKALEQTSPVPMAFEDIPGGAKGFFSPVESRIAIQEGMSEIQTVKTAIHEIAHAKLHAVKPDEKAAPEDKKDRHTKEVEAESVAYTVCQRYGIETSDYSFGYIAGWSSGKETKELKSSLDTIRKTAAEMIEGIDAKLKVLLAEKAQSAEMEVEAPVKEAVPEEKPEVPIYRETANYAYEAGELESYRASLAANVECRRAIEAAISSNYGDNRLDADAAVKSVLEQFSPERVRYVLANTIQQKDFDGRIPQPLKEWAKTVEVCPENASRFLVDKPNPGLTALFVDAFRQQTEAQKDVTSEKATERDPEVVAWENDEITSIEVKTVEVKSPFAPLPEEAAKAPKAHRLTAEEKEIKAAVMDTLKGQIAYNNDGMRASYRASNHSFNLLARSGVKIEGNTVTQNGEPLFKIHRRHAARKTQGCYRELMPTLEYVKQEQKQEKPSIRDQLKAAAKTQPEKKSPVKSKTHDMEL